MRVPSNNRGSVLVKVVAVLALLAAAAFAVAYFMRPLAVVTPVVPGKAINAVPGSVVVAAEFTMEMKSEIGGRVIKSDLDAGRYFKKGDFLVQIDPGDLQLDIQRAEAELRALKNRIAVGSQLFFKLETAKEDLANKDRLFKLGQLSETEITRAKREVTAIEQQKALEEVENQRLLDVSETALKVNRRKLEKMTITAPFDGVVSVVYARPGDLIAADASIASLIATSRTVEAKISEENFSGIQVGQKASVKFLGYGSQMYGASVIKVLPTADPTTQRYIVHLNVDLPAEKLVPGLTGEVSIVLGERDAKTTVPRRALRGNEIFVVNGSTVELRKVQLGYVGLNQAEVLEGLRENELVIVEELERFQAGDRVRVSRAEAAGR